jgi:CheY-like chemotaxis protein
MLSGWQPIGVREADTGVEGLRLARDLRPDAVLLDVRLPDVDGFEVMARLAADPETAGIPVIICTSSVLTEAERNRLGRARSILSKAALTRDSMQSALSAAWQDVSNQDGPIDIGRLVE